MYEIFRDCKHDLDLATQKLSHFGVTRIIHIKSVNVYLFYAGNKLINTMQL